MSRHRPFVFGCGFNGFGQLLPCDENYGKGNVPTFSPWTARSEMVKDTSTQHPCSWRQPKTKAETAVVVPAELSLCSSGLCLPVAHCTRHLERCSQQVDTKDDKSEARQLQTEQNISSTNSEDECTLIKQIQVGWDRILFSMTNEDKNSCLLIRQGMQTDTTGERLSREKLDVKHVAVSWQHTFLVTQSGTCLVAHNFKQSEMVQVRMLPSADQTADTGHSADTVEIVESGGKHTVATFDGGKLGQIELDVDRDIFFCRPVNLHLNVKAVSCGKEHVILLTRIGMVLTFGTGGQGQLGHGDIENKETAQIVEALEGVTMTAVVAGGWHSVALSDIGDVYTWGWNERGQLGLPSRIIREQNSTLQRDTLQTPTSHNSSRSCEGQTAAAATTSSLEPSELADELVNIQTLPAVLDIIEDGDNVDAVNISAGSRHTAAVTENSTLLTWGWNEYGQLGHGDTVSRDSPTVVSYFRDRDLQVSGVVCGSWNTIVTVLSG